VSMSGFSTVHLSNCDAMSNRAKKEVTPRDSRRTFNRTNRLTVLLCATQKTRCSAHCPQGGVLFVSTDDYQEDAIPSFCPPMRIGVNIGKIPLACAASATFGLIDCRLWENTARVSCERARGACLRYDAPPHVDAASSPHAVWRRARRCERDSRPRAGNAFRSELGQGTIQRQNND
jgi:hypothetical protein